MAPPVEKKKKLSSADHCLISSATISEHQQQSSSGSVEIAFGEPEEKMGNRVLRKIWICSDVLMNILPFFGHAQLGLKLALISPRFDALVDTHFNGGTTKFIIRRIIRIQKDNGAEEPNICVFTSANYANAEQFPLPDRPLPKSIRFNDFRITYVDHTVLAFLRSNQQIWDKGTKLDLRMCNPPQSIWDVFVRQIWPLFEANIRKLHFWSGSHLDNLRRLISPTILSDLNPMSIYSGGMLTDVIADEGPNATDGQALAKWLHIRRKDGHPKRLACRCDDVSAANEWVSNFKQAFLCATNCARYTITLDTSALIEPFELVNEQTKEKLTLNQVSENVFSFRWRIKRRSIIGRTAAVQRKAKNPTYDLNTVIIALHGTYGTNCIGQLSPSTETGQSNENGI